MNIYHNIKDNNNIILIFGGFASHPSHFIPIYGDNIIIVYNYSSADFSELVYVIEKCNVTTVIAFSMGVSMAYKFFSENCNMLNDVTKIAINGTGNGIDREFGIDPFVFKAVYRKFNLEVFVNNLFDCHIDKAKKFKFEFLDIDTLKSELLFFIKQDYKFVKSIHWNKIYISKNDLIFPSNSQINFWNKEGLSSAIAMIEAPHFAFFDLALYE